MARRHVVTLHDADLDRGALLLERLLPGTRLADEPDRWPLEEVEPVLSDLWRQPSWLGAVPGLPELRERAEFVFELTRRRFESHPDVAGRVTPGLVEGARSLASALSGEGPVRLLHGDLHPGNVLRGGDGRELVAIDPRPCLGDPAFDAVDWVLAGGLRPAGRPATRSSRGRQGDRAAAEAEENAAVLVLDVRGGQGGDDAELLGAERRTRSPATRSAGGQVPSGGAAGRLPTGGPGRAVRRVRPSAWPGR